jgi:hypothetical protein
MAQAKSGGTHTSRTIMLDDLRRLFEGVTQDATTAEYRTAVLEDNLLGKKSESSRQRSHRYLRELYILDPASRIFRALRELWAADFAAQPLLAILTATSRDPLLRATAELVVDTPEGAPISSEDLTGAVRATFPDSYSESVAAKVGRNTASSWTQSGHLTGYSSKSRVRADCRPAAVAMALFLAYLYGGRGEALFETIFARILDRLASEIRDQAFAAAQRGWLELRQAGNVVEIGFRHFLRPLEAA